MTQSILDYATNAYGLQGLILGAGAIILLHAFVLQGAWSTAGDLLRRQSRKPILLYLAVLALVVWFDRELSDEEFSVTTYAWAAIGATMARVVISRVMQRFTTEPDF